MNNGARTLRKQSLIIRSIIQDNSTVSSHCQSCSHPPEAVCDLGWRCPSSLNTCMYPYTCISNLQYFGLVCLLHKWHHVVHLQLAFCISRRSWALCWSSLFFLTCLTIHTSSLLCRMFRGFAVFPDSEVLSGASLCSCLCTCGSVCLWQTCCTTGVCPCSAVLGLVTPPPSQAPSMGVLIFPHPTRTCYDQMSKRLCLQKLHFPD